MGLALSALDRARRHDPVRRRHRPGQDLAGLRAGAVRLPPGPLGALPARAAPGRGAAHPARHGAFAALAAAVGQDRRAGLGRLGTGAIDATTRADLLEIIDDRAGQRATIITHQLPVEHWHAWIGDPTDRRRHPGSAAAASHRLNLKGESCGRAKQPLCKPKAATPPTPQNTGRIARPRLRQLQPGSRSTTFKQPLPTIHSTQLSTDRSNRSRSPKSSVTFAGIRTLSTELTTRSSVVDADAARRRRLLLSCAMCASHHSAASFHQTSHAMSLS